MFLPILIEQGLKTRDGIPKLFRNKTQNPFRNSKFCHKKDATLKSKLIKTAYQDC